MKKTIGIISILLVLIFAFFGMNFIWGWVDIDFKMVGKTGLTIIIGAFAILFVTILWYVFMKKHEFYRNPEKPHSRAQVKE